MPADKRLIQQSITAFDFPTLFREGLGWDTLRERAIPVEVDGQTYTLQPLAGKRDIKAYRCSPDAQGRVPIDAVRRKIDREVTKFAYEHLILYTDAVAKEQVWQWVRREPGKLLTPRYLHYYRGKVGEAAAQQLSLLAVDILEEDVIDRQEMTGRVRKAFDVERVTKKFYDRFQKEHAVFDDFIKGITVEADQQWYTSLMRLPSIVFSTRAYRGTATAPEAVLLYMRTGDGADALAWVDRKGEMVTQSQVAILRAAACTIDEPAIPRPAQQHDLVRTGVEQIVATQAESTGGQLGSPSGARRRTYDRLCLVQEQGEQQEPQIICSLGLFEVGE